MVLRKRQNVLSMVDILYIVGKGFSEWNNNELRYSLRSIAKYGKNVGRIFICGYIPGFVNRETVNCLHLRDEGTNKHYNIMRAIEYAVANSDIGPRFLLSSDDHYYVQPTDFDKYPVYWRGKELPVQQEGNRWYDITLHSTREILDAFALPAFFYAWHGNTYFNRTLFESRRFELIRRLAQTMPEACEPSCLMLNYWRVVSPDTMPEHEKIKDGKVNTANTIEEIEQMAECKHVLSTTDAVGPAMKLWLQQKFPKKSKYEIQ